MRMQQPSPPVNSSSDTPPAILPPESHQHCRLHHIRPADIFISIDSPPQSDSSASSSSTTSSCGSTNSLMAVAATTMANTTLKNDDSLTLPVTAESATLSVELSSKDSWVGDDHGQDDEIAADEEGGANWPLIGGRGRARVQPIRSAPPVAAKTTRWQQSMGFSLDHSLMMDQSPQDYNVNIYKIPTDHRRKIKIEENANVVAAVWGTEFPNLAALTDLL